MYVCISMYVCMYVCRYVRTYDSSDEYGVALPLQLTDCAMLLLLFYNSNK